MSEITSFGEDPEAQLIERTAASPVRLRVNAQPLHVDGVIKPNSQPGHLKRFNHEPTDGNPECLSQC